MKTWSAHAQKLVRKFKLTNSTSSVLAIITARGGSKGVPGKNLRLLAGRPLIEWTIDAAQSANCVTHTIVSTDAPSIAAAAVAAGADVPFLRPSELATDTASSVDVVAHALEECPGYDYFVLLQPTSPLRTGPDIDAAFSRLQNANAKSCVSVSEVEKSPWLMFILSENDRLQRLLPPWSGGMRRQDLPKTYVLNGAIYFSQVSAFSQSRQLVTDASIGHILPNGHALDIDTLDDFYQAEELLLARQKQNSYS